MSVNEFMNWLGVSGLALLSLYYSRKNKEKEQEHQFIDKLTETVDLKDKQYKDLLSRIETIEKVNNDLRIENLKLLRENDVLKFNNVSLENELLKKLKELEDENKYLKDKIQQLEKVVKNSTKK